MREKVFVTGGAGFIGSWICKYHLDKGDEVWALDNLTTGREENLSSFRENSHFKFTQDNLLAWQDLPKAIEFATRIYHFAAIVGQKVVTTTPGIALEENIRGCEILLKTMADLKSKAKIIIASSSEVYGIGVESSFKEDEIISFQPTQYIQNSYSLSKFENETMAQIYADRHGLFCVAARLFNTAGPRQTGRYGMVIPRFIQQCLKDEPLTVYGDGRQTRSFCHVLDTVTMLDLLLSHPESSGSVCNVGNDQEITILELAELIKKELGSKSEIVFIPYTDVYGFNFKDVLRRKPDLTKMKKLLNFTPKRSLQEIIRSIKDEAFSLKK